MATTTMGAEEYLHDLQGRRPMKCTLGKDQIFHTSLSQLLRHPVAEESEQQQLLI